jgi:monoterpene epsilon-lactone hydrolase
MAGAEPSAELVKTRSQIDAAMGGRPLAPDTTAVNIDAGGVPAIECRRNGGDRDPCIIYFHGGGYRLGSALAWRSYGSHLAAACKVGVVLVDYRLAPEHPFPAAVDDALRAYLWAVQQAAGDSAVIVGGDSAGGGLAAALVEWVAKRGDPLPAGAICLSPWADLTNTAGTFAGNAGRDTLFSKMAADEAAQLYLGDGDRTDPLASPVCGRWPAQVPLLIQVGDTEVLLDDAARLEGLGRDAGAPTFLHVYPDMLHVWQLQYPDLPDAVAAVEEIAAFVGRLASGPGTGGR